MAFKRFLVIFNLLLLTNAHSISIENPPGPPADPHSVNARQANSELEGCVIKDQSFVCDPDLVLTQEERDQLLRFLKSLESDTRNPFGKTDCERKGLTVGVAISSTKITPEEEKEEAPAPAEADAHGHDWNEHNHHSHDEPDKKGEKDSKDPKHLPDVQMEHYFIPYPPIPPPSFASSKPPSSGSRPELTPCFVSGGLSLNQLLGHQEHNNNRFTRELMRGWGIDNESCVEKSAIIFLSPVHPLPNPESDDLNCFYTDKTSSFREKRYLEGLLEMLEEQRQIHLDAKLFSAIETCRSLALPGSSPFIAPNPVESTTSKYAPTHGTHANTATPTSGNLHGSTTDKSNYQQEYMSNMEEQHLERVKRLEVEQWQKQQQLQKTQFLQCSSSQTTNTLLTLLFLTITSQTLLLLAIIVLKMRGFFNKPAGTIIPAAATMTSPPPMYNLKPVLSPSSFFDHLEDKKNGSGFKR